MKLVVRIFALSVVVAGAAAAVTPSAKPAMISHQSATAAMPAPPMCNPVTPCPTQPGTSLRVQ